MNICWCSQFNSVQTMRASRSPSSAQTTAGLLIHPHDANIVVRHPFHPCLIIWSVQVCPRRNCSRNARQSNCWTWRYVAQIRMHVLSRIKTHAHIWFAGMGLQDLSRSACSSRYSSESTCNCLLVLIHWCVCGCRSVLRTQSFRSPSTEVLLER